jgi:hypothetical protein
LAGERRLARRQGRAPLQEAKFVDRLVFFQQRLQLRRQRRVLPARTEPGGAFLGGHVERPIQMRAQHLPTFVADRGHVCSVPLHPPLPRLEIYPACF